MADKSKGFRANPRFKFFLIVVVVLLLLSVYSITKYQQKSQNDSGNWPASFGFGRTATAQEIYRRDIDVRPDGKGLPSGSGDVASGKMIYNAKCVACHGAADVDYHDAKLPAPALFTNAFAKNKTKTIGNYWPYATTIFDYVRRTMPYNAPGSLTNEEVYSVTAYLLNANKLLKTDAVLNAKTLPKVKMPAQKLFVPDDRNGSPEIK